MKTRTRIGYDNKTCITSPRCTTTTTTTTQLESTPKYTNIQLEMGVSQLSTTHQMMKPTQPIIYHSNFDPTKLASAGCCLRDYDMNVGKLHYM